MAGIEILATIHGYVIVWDGQHRVVISMMQSMKGGDNSGIESMIIYISLHLMKQQDRTPVYV